MSIRRRTLLHAAAAALTGGVAGGCALTGGLPEMDPLQPGRTAGAARLSARLPDRSDRSAPPGPPAPGLHALPVDAGREVLLYVPADAPAPGPSRLVLALHGAGGDARGGLAPLLPLADAHGLLLLSPTSLSSTWDAIGERWGPDVRSIDAALAQVFATCRVDPARIAVSGFSDGATYALSLGLANADLFTAVIAFSPGYVVPAPRIGTPRVFVSHGRADAVLPIDRTTRRIVPWLQAAQVPTQVREFDGPHIVPAAVAEEAVRWLVA